MPPTTADRLLHILEAINDIQTLLTGLTVPELAADKYRRIAVERFFEIICEASRNVPDNVKSQQPDIDWRGMLDFGNQLRHAYHRIEPTLLWDIAERDLPPLKAFVERMIRNQE